MMDYDEFLKLIQSAQEITEHDIASQDAGDIKSILKQRQYQRETIFKFSIWIAGLSFLALMIIIGLQSWYRIRVDKNFVLLNGYELEVLSVAIFGQTLGVIIVIAKSLWDDSPYKGVLKIEEDAE